MGKRRMDQSVQTVLFFPFYGSSCYKCNRISVTNFLLPLQLTANQFTCLPASQEQGSSENVSPYIIK